MGSFDWMELDTLTREIEHTQSRLGAARGTRNHGLVTLLEREIADAAKRRFRVLADITNALGGSANTKPYQRPTLVREAQLINTEGEQTAEKHRQPPQHAENAEPFTTGSLVSPGSLQPPSSDGVAAMWDRLTAADIEQAKRTIVNRRAEMLARHAEELKALDAEQSEINTIEQAIDAFARKFKIGGAEVVPFDAERSTHTQLG